MNQKWKTRSIGRLSRRLLALVFAALLTLMPAGAALAGPASESGAGLSGPAAPEGEVRGVWISYLDWNSWPKDYEGFKGAVDAAMDRCREKGLNTVFLHVRPDGDAMYPSRYFPWSKFASGVQGQDPGYDPLAYAVESAHQRGLKIHAWINPFRITGYLNRYGDLCASNPAVAWKTDGDPSNDRWVLEHQGEYYYNPAIPQVRQRIIDGVREIAENYPVDGIHFDDYFYPNVNDGDPALWFDLPEYMIASSFYPSAAEWRRENVNQLIRGVYSTVKAINPQMEFGISPEGYLKNLRLDTRLFVDIDTWMTQPGYIDYIMPQIYWGFEAKQGGQPAPYAFENCLREWIELKKKGNVKLCLGLALYKTGTDAADGNETPEWLRYQDIMRRQVIAGRTTGEVSGYCLYDFSSLTRAAAAAEVENVTALFR